MGDEFVCSRATSPSEPCAARDGDVAVSRLRAVCAGCGERPADLLRDLVRAVLDHEHEHESQHDDGGES